MTTLTITDSDDAGIRSQLNHRKRQYCFCSEQLALRVRGGDRCGDLSDSVVKNNSKILHEVPFDVHEMWANVKEKKKIYAGKTFQAVWDVPSDIF